jgi:TonB-linked SusC/RagA family outer membrane protein
MAQKQTVTGTITDQTGETVIGANVVEKGTTNGTGTDADGKFVLTVGNNAVLQISFIGFKTQEIAVANRTTLSIVLQEDLQSLDEVIVTALGIKREEKSLGYAVQKIDGDDLLVAKGSNIGTSLTGKVSGMDVFNNTEFAQSPGISVRGSGAILVVDGVPHYNLSLADISADDIESISILKGSTASALYGSRGGGGAIMITTKKGNADGLNISVNSNTMFNAGYLKIPDVQHSYSSGGGSKYYTGDYVWGDKLDEERIGRQYNPFTYEWEDRELKSVGKNNYYNFLEQAFVTNNNVSISQKGSLGSFRSSLNHIYNKGQYPNNKEQKFSFMTSGEMNVNRFHLEGGITYDHRMFTSRIGTGYGRGSYMYNLLIWTGAEYDIRDFRNYWQEGKENERQNWTEASAWYDNPYFMAYEHEQPFERDIVTSYVNMSFDLTSWLKASLKLGGDNYSERWTEKHPVSFSTEPKGRYQIWNYRGLSTTDDFMLTADRKFGDFSINGFAGASIFYRQYDYLYSTTSNGLTIPGYYSLKASVDPATTESGVTRQQTNSAYGKIGITWKDAIFLEATGRNDWSSTLSEKERSYFYPSVAGSILLSELIKMPSWLTFWKLRGSWTQTKYAPGVYDINASYGISNNFWGTMTAATYPTSIRDATLHPSSTREYEFGTNLRFLNNRLNLDVAYYNKRYYDNQAWAGMSNASGYGSTLINTEEEYNRHGVEASLIAKIIENKDFKWTSTFNWSTYEYVLSKIDPVFTGNQNMPWQKEGRDLNSVINTDWERDPSGNLILYNGMPAKTRWAQVFGTTTPDWIFGWTNEFHYKDFSLTMSFDGRVGGIARDQMDQRLWHSGSHVDSDNQWRYDEVVNGKKNYVAPGVKIVSGSIEYDDNGVVLSDSRVFAPNDVEVSYESYIRRWSDINDISPREWYVPKTYCKLRELSLGYTLPQKVCKPLYINSAEIALVGQNLLLLSKSFRWSDPDLGDENINSPSIRYFGCNIVLNF